MRGVRFSIITVCYNAEAGIRETVESVLSQTWGEWEYIVVDGASTDATVEILRQYAEREDRMTWYSEPDSGIFHAMNKGIRYASGEYLIFLNAGDSFHSEGVLDAAAALAAKTRADILVGDVAFKGEHGLNEHIYAVGSELYDNLKRGNCVCHQVIFASKACLEGGFDEKFRICADYDWLCRQVQGGKNIAKLNTVVTDYDVHGVTSQARYQRIHWDEYFEIIGRYFPQPGFPYGEEVKKLFVQERKERFQYRYMNQWLSLKQRGVSLSSFFVRRNIDSIAIYGIHYMGQRLYDELKGSPVKAAYAIDRNPDGYGWAIPVFHPEDRLEAVGAVVITPVFDFDAVRNMLCEKLDCPMVSIEEILYDEAVCRETGS